MRLALLAVVLASSSGCLAHERPDAVDAAAPPDAFVGHDAFAHDAPFVPRDAFGADAYSEQCVGLFHRVPDSPILQLTQRACSVGQPQCRTFEAEGVDAPSPTDGLRIARCAPGSTQTTVRATVLATSSSSTGCRACLIGAPCATSVGDVIEMMGTSGGFGDIPQPAFEDDIAFLCSGWRFHVEVCAIGPCP